MTQEAVPGNDEPALGSQPAEGRGEFLRRRWRSRGRHAEVPYWLIVRGVPVAAVYGGLYVLGGFILGWRVTYDVTLGITSPADTATPVVAWVISLAGWLAVPVIAGGVGGYVIGKQISSRRKLPVAELFREEGDG